MTTVHTVTPKTLSEWLGADEAILVDVREPVEYQGEFIEPSKNLPLSQITLDEAHLPEHRHKKLVLNCQTGRRSKMACEKLIEDGATEVWNLEGGLSGWKAANLPTSKSSKSILPLDQQVQATLGALILIGVMMAILTSTAWLIVPAIVGLGLLNAGITGWCGLAKLMAKMPWNQK